MDAFDEGRLLALLDRLEGFWRDQHHPLAGSVRPGLTAERIEELMAPTGLTLPPELVTWWSWHDGSQPARRLYDDFVFGQPFFSLERAVETYQWWMTPENQPASLDSVLADYWWRPSWFPISMDQAGVPFVDTATVTAGGTVPVRYIDTPMWEMWELVIAPTFTDYIAMVVRLYDVGAMWWDSDGLSVDFDRIPSEVSPLRRTF